MEWLIWIGAALSILGLAGLLWSIAKVWSARRARLEDEALRAVLRRMMPVNMGALMLSTLGLMLVIVGIFLA